MNGSRARRWQMAVVAASVLAACAGEGFQRTDGSAAAADYATHADQFALLQQAGLAADYGAFATHLKADDPETVVNALQRAFAGEPFDTYTNAATAGPDAHRRVVELRNATGRLYLYVQLDKVPGGWRVASYDLGADRTEISARL